MEERKKAIQSLKIAKGQIEGIIKMIEDGRYCIDISNQIIAVQSLLKKSNMPRIINIASRLGTKPMEASVAYCTSEAATIMLTQCCALELTKKYNIKTNTVSPSMTLTPLAKKSYTEDEIKKQQ